MNPPHIHMTGSDAAAVAKAAGVARLVLTHVLGSLDRNRSLAEAQTTFDGDLALAEDLRSWLLA